MATDPVDKVARLSVNPWEPRFSASVTPARNSVEIKSAGEGAPGVPLARVLPSLGQPGADHRVGDVTLTIGVAAVLVTDHGHLDLHEDAGEAAAHRGGAPARHGAHGALRDVLVSGGQGDGADIGVTKVSLLLKMKQTNVVCDGPGVIVIMSDDPGDSDVNLARILLIEIVATNPDGEMAC